MSTQNCFPKVAVGAVIFDENKILLVKRSNPPAKGKWAVPGGKVMAGENLQYALKREILEETGLDSLVIHPFTKEFSRMTAGEYVHQMFEV